MLDEGVTKFIGVFSAVSEEEPRIADDRHIAAIRFWTPSEVTAGLANPSQFTPSLLHVLHFHGQRARATELR